MQIPREKWSHNFGEWFDKVIFEAEIYDYGRYPVKGMGVWMPYGFKIREKALSLIRNLLNGTGHEEVLFPMLIPEDLLQKETEHIEGFENEVFWVTKGGLQQLDVKLALRPTSEVAITYMESLWIKSYRQLPKKYYQIVSIFRYETKSTRPLIRVREVSTFKEAHTIHETYEDADNQVKEAISIYKKFFDELGIPYIISERPSWDRFAGALHTYAFDTIMPDGRVLQIGTVHHLGQHFTKAFDYKIQKADGNLDYPHQTSYGISDRVIAVLVSINGDDHGPILTPLVAPIQVVVIPIPAKNENDTTKIMSYAKEITQILNENNISVYLDEEKDKTPGEKFYYWELKGVPLRIELGMRETNGGSVTIKRRDDLTSKVVIKEKMVDEVKGLLNEVRRSVRDRAWIFFNQKVKFSTDPDSAKKSLEEGGIVEVPWCGEDSCGLKVEEITGGKVLGYPIESKEINESCIVCKKPAKTTLRIAKTY
ncbi:MULTISPECIES: proline--tRNA ligase [Acidianus]|uniref:Proline--tRNA ligase n=1 Tax=Candidatus Acidianus copahuensis TaxID=1160895 RepID=A0A031LMX9_9CREN|nr:MULTISPECIES: proline--tRNA ligase [Acidianus]EZQ07003.1 prolyl-tRNA synthetase [Candidatus Acidianus copahuensis]NON61161.1 proline--tRNA ligase [Acidianus sp. RZ1]